MGRATACWWLTPAREIWVHQRCLRSRAPGDADRMPFRINLRQIGVEIADQTTLALIDTVQDWNGASGKSGAAAR